MYGGVRKRHTESDTIQDKSCPYLQTTDSGSAKLEHFGDAINLIFSPSLCVCVCVCVCVCAGAFVSVRVRACVCVCV